MLKTKPQLLRRVRGPIEGLFCCYPHRECMQERLDGYEFCQRHILEDKNAPFKQCNYVSNRNGKRCPNAAPKSDKKEGFCPDHARKSLMMRQRASRKRRPRETPETLLEQIEHYGSKQDGLGRDGVKRGRPSLEALTNRLLDYASSSDSESEQPLVDQAWRGDVDSDAESVDSEQEDLLKHAGIYTAEEVAQITRDKLIRLQSLYIEQFKRLQHVMKEKRRKYLHSARRERETLGSVHAAKEDPEQREAYEKLAATKRYHKRFGKEALLHRQSKERRISVTEGTNYRPPAYPKCIYNQKGNKCGSRTVPLSKYCNVHILHDPHQVLFQTCSYGNGTCERALAPAANGKPPRCNFHQEVTDFQKRFPPQQEPDETREVDVVGSEDEAALLAAAAGASLSASSSSATLDATPSASLPQEILASPPEIPQEDTAELGSELDSKPEPMDTNEEVVPDTKPDGQ